MGDVIADDTSVLVDFDGPPTRYSLSSAYVDALEDLRSRGVASLGEIQMRHNTYSVFSKLAYWSLIEHPVDPKSGKPIMGLWQITAAGRAWLDGRLRVRMRVYAVNGARIAWDDTSPPVTAQELKDKGARVRTPGRQRDRERFA